MIRLRHQQPSLWETFFAEEVAELREPWMQVVDELLRDDELLDIVYEAQGRRRAQSRTHGRHQTPAEVVLRMLILKHVRNWSYEVLEREVRANAVYRTFCRIGMEKVPDAKTLVRLGQAIGPEALGELHNRIVALAQERKVVHGRKMRVDTTVVESNVHYPTDSGLLQDGARVMTRSMQKIEKKAGGLKRKIRNRMRSVTKRVIAIGHALRHKGSEGEEKRKREYKELLSLTRRILNDARRVLQEVETMPRGRRQKVRGISQQLQAITEQVRNVIRQTRARLFRGVTQFPEKIVSLFEPHTEIIRKGKAGKPNEFGKLLQVQEAENQIITHYEVFDQRPSDQRLLVGAVKAQQQKLGRVPKLVAADAGFYSRENEQAVQQMGVAYVSIPNRNTRSEERRKLQKRRWFKAGQKWRTGCEGRISVLKRRHGLSRCRYRGLAGMRRWVGLGVIADNLLNIGRYLAPKLA
ncbi:MAG: ISNCY family transposase [Acidobacteriaceae bacterium]|nr:ISNCY family transposase [Acidobacteriaceae bacterium]